MRHENVPIILMCSTAHPLQTHNSRTDGKMDSMLGDAILSMVKSSSAELTNLLARILVNTCVLKQISQAVHGFGVTSQCCGSG